MTIADKIGFIESLKSDIERLLPQKNWDDSFLKKVKADFTYNSNKLEGNTLTYGQTIKLLRDFVTPKNTFSAEVLDMLNHQKVLDIVFRNYRSQELSEENIKALHKELMKSIEQWADDGLYSPGLYKSFDNVTVRSTGKLHYYIQPKLVQKSMEELLSITNESFKNIDVTIISKHPLTIATYFHQQFLNKIHPFSDGNGRIGRIFTNLILLKCGYPPIFIKATDKDEYLKRFELSDSDIQPMLEFMADRLVESLEEKLKFINVQRGE